MLSKVRKIGILMILLVFVLGLSACSDEEEKTIVEEEGKTIAEYESGYEPMYLEKDQDQWYGIFWADPSDSNYIFCVGEDPGNMEQKYASTDVLNRAEDLKIGGGNAAWFVMEQGVLKDTLKYYDGADGTVVDILRVDARSAKSPWSYSVVLDERYVAWVDGLYTRKPGESGKFSIQYYDNKTKEIATLHQGKAGEYCRGEMYLYAGKLYYMIQDSAAGSIVLYTGDLTKGTTEVVAKEPYAGNHTDEIVSNLAFFVQDESLVYEVPKVYEGENIESEIIVNNLATATKQRYPLPQDANYGYRSEMCCNGDSFLVDFGDREDTDIRHLAIFEYGDTKLTPFYSYRFGEDDPFIHRGDLALLEDQAVWIGKAVQDEFGISPLNATLKVYDFESETIAEVDDAIDFIVDGENLYYLIYQETVGASLKRYH